MKISHRPIRSVLPAALLAPLLVLLLSGCVSRASRATVVPLSVNISSRAEPQSLPRGQEAQIRIVVEIDYQAGEGSQTFIATATVQPESGLRFVQDESRAKVDSRKGRWAQRTLSMWPAEQRQLEFLLQVSPDIEVGRYKIVVDVKQASDSSLLYEDALFLSVGGS